MINRPSVLLSVLFTAVFTQLSISAEELTPGLYKTTVSFEGKMGQLSLPARTEERNDCITAQDIENGPPLSMPENTPSDCEVLNYEYGDGKLSMEMSCKMQGGEGKMVGSGTYTSDSFEMSTQMKLALPGAEMEMSTRSTGQRISGC